MGRRRQTEIRKGKPLFKLLTKPQNHRSSWRTTHRETYQTLQTDKRETRLYIHRGLIRQQVTGGERGTAKHD